MSERALVTLRRIETLSPIEGADRIELAKVGGWQSIVPKGVHTEGGLVRFYEIDSFLRLGEKDTAFLEKSCKRTRCDGKEGLRIKSMKMKGVLSQGLILPIDERTTDLPEGTDVTDLLGVEKWEDYVPPQMQGKAHTFPTFIPKTDQERVQNLRFVPKDKVFQVTEKLDGMSITVYLKRKKDTGEVHFGVCSRNQEIERDDNNVFWKTVNKLGVEEIMRSHLMKDDLGFALQGELVGPGIQRNHYKLLEHDIYFYNLYDIAHSEYLSPALARQDVIRWGLKWVPVTDTVQGRSAEECLEAAEGPSKLCPQVEREGLVFKAVHGDFSFKAISNKFLLKTDS